MATKVTSSSFSPKHPKSQSRLTPAPLSSLPSPTTPSQRSPRRPKWTSTVRRKCSSIREIQVSIRSTWTFWNFHLTRHHHQHQWARLRARFRESIQTTQTTTRPSTKRTTRTTTNRLKLPPPPTQATTFQITFTPCRVWSRSRRQSCPMPSAFRLKIVSKTDRLFCFILIRFD